VIPARLLPFVELLIEDPDAILHLALGNHSELSRSALIGSEQVSHAKLGPADPRFPVQRSLLVETLGLMQSLAITGALPPSCMQLGLGAESGEFYTPPTTHLIATVQDLTNMLDYASEDINGMDDDADSQPNQVPPIMGYWTATSTYDVYMVDTPDKKDDEDNQNPDEDNPVNKPPKHRRQWRRSRSHRAKDSSTGTGGNETPDDAEDPEYPVEPTSEQGEREEGQYSLEHADHEDSEESN